LASFFCQHFSARGAAAFSINGKGDGNLTFEKEEKKVATQTCFLDQKSPPLVCRRYDCHLIATPMAKLKSEHNIMALRIAPLLWAQLGTPLG